MVNAILLLIAIAGLVFSALYTFKNKISFLKGICIGTLALTVVFILSVSYDRTVNNISPIDMVITATFDGMKQVIDEMPKETLETFSALGETNIEVIRSTLKASVESVREAYMVLFPSIMIIMFAGFVLVLFMLIKNIIKLFGKDVSFIPNFNQIRANKGFVVAYIIFNILSLVLPYSTVGHAIANILLIMSAYVYISTLSIVDYFLQKRIKLLVIRFIILLIFILTMSMAFQIASLFVIIDAFWDFRARGEVK